MKDNNPGASVFVKISDYREIINVMDILKGKLREAKATLARVESLRNQEEEQINQWNSAIDEVDSRIISIDKNLLEPQR